MTEQEFIEILEDLFPDELLGYIRPNAGIENTLEFSDYFPQFIQKDKVWYKQINSVLMRLLSNDCNLKKWIDQLMDALNKEDFELATQTIKGLMSAQDKKKLDEIESGAQVNQNAFGVIKIGDKTYTANEVQDILNFVAGNNVEIKLADNGKVTINVKNISDGAEVNQNAISKILVGTSTINATTKEDSLTIAAGKMITINADTKEKKVTIAANIFNADGQLVFPDGSKIRVI
ncbi:hypothetical protein [Anaerosinus massiliensis]|uniref:hypothetical protein n=1 Tax=Massilibacillus massiliensis TaxID=1806837 RepID=UPI000DA63519|nr:hypothetical protein [Massilibacillus massiliensis]